MHGAHTERQHQQQHHSFTQSMRSQMNAPAEPLKQTTTEKGKKGKNAVYVAETAHYTLNGSHFSLRTQTKDHFASVKNEKAPPFRFVTCVFRMSFFPCSEFRFRRRCGDSVWFFLSFRWSRLG